MSAATNKNAQALKALFGSMELADRLARTRIAVVTPDIELTASGRILGEVLADTLARLWPNISFVGAAANNLLTVARDAAGAGESPTDGLIAGWCPPYDCVVAIGCQAPSSSVDVLRVGADGWIAQLGREAACGDDTNPVGPAFAAAFVAAQVFRRVFGEELNDLGAEPVSDMYFDVRNICGADDLSMHDLSIGELHVFGVGAVTHAMMWLLQRWPASVCGTVNLVDQDKYGASNAQRYAFMRSGDVGKEKVAVMRERLVGAHAELAASIHAHPLDLNTYCAQRGYSTPLLRVIVGLDSAESRRHAALKLPEHAINMWTEGVRIGASRYLPGSSSACLACDYLEDTSSPRDEVGQLVLQTGLRPDVVRSLLDTARALSAEEAALVGSRWQMPANELIGQPLRSVLPVLCAMGRLQLPTRNEAVDVPFAFASLFAGIAGFVMLLKDLRDAEASEGWGQHIFKPPTAHMHALRHVRAGCVCCGEVAMTSS